MNEQQILDELETLGKAYVDDVTNLLKTSETGVELMTKAQELAHAYMVKVEDTYPDSKASLDTNNGRYKAAYLKCALETLFNGAFNEDTSPWSQSEFEEYRENAAEVRQIFHQQIQDARNLSNNDAKQKFEQPPCTINVYASLYGPNNTSEQDTGRTASLMSVMKSGNNLSLGVSNKPMG